MKKKEQQYVGEMVLTRLLLEAQDRYPIGCTVPREEVIAWIETRPIHWWGGKL